MAQPTLEENKDTSSKQLYFPKTANIVRAEKVSDKEKLFELKFADGSELGHIPGQFVEVSVYGIGECPISVSSAPTRSGSFELVVRKVGNVTSAMHKLNTGDTLGIRGPFGRGFDTDFLKGKDILFIGGGIGMVPLRSLINYVLDKRENYGKVTILYGCKEPAELIFPEERSKWEKREDVDYHITVDKCKPEDNWKENIGVITTLIPSVEIFPAITYAVVVGPPIMYRFVIKSLKEKNVPDDHIILSLERRMKCGVGKCGHCQIGNFYCCQDGPIFYYSEIKNLKEAL
ncbi:MAG: FAD/NAD(P)-binding protein [Planctomycetota bacterium]